MLTLSQLNICNFVLVYFGSICIYLWIFIYFRLWMCVSSWQPRFAIIFLSHKRKYTICGEIFKYNLNGIFVGLPFIYLLLSSLSRQLVFFFGICFVLFSFVSTMKFLNNQNLLIRIRILPVCHRHRRRLFSVFRFFFLCSQ